MTLTCSTFAASTLPGGRIQLRIDGVEESDRPLFKSEAAAFLQVGTRTLENYMRRAKNPIPYSRAGGRPRFLRREIEDWLARERKSGNARAAVLA